MSGGAPFKTVSVIGAGAWGTALANLAAHNGVAVILWAREPEVVEAVNTRHENETYLAGVHLHQAISATDSLEDVGRAEAFLFVVPAQYSRQMMTDLRPHAKVDAPIALCSKGVEQKTGLLLSEVLAETWPEARQAVLSGPSFARDVANGLPTAVTLAVADAGLGARWTATVGAPHFRPYLSGDVIGAELGGAFKNVLAIAAGAVIGRGLGESARAALIARGFAEFQRLGVALGAERETMAGLSGLGDLILTATSAQSRNCSLGEALGEGRALADILGERNTVSEGVATASAVVALADKAGVEVPIASAVAELVAGTRSVDELIAALLARPFRQEFE